MVKVILLIVAAALIVTLIRRFWGWLLIAAIVGLIFYFLLHRNGQKKPQKRQRPRLDTSRTEEKKPRRVVKAYPVKGVYYNKTALRSMMKPNRMYSYGKRDLIDCGCADTRIFEYTIEGEPVELVPEPDNPHDPNAIRVVIGGQKVGYIAAKDCPHILKLIKANRINGIHYVVQGGRYKELVEDYDPDRDRSTYTMETGTDDYGVTLYIGELTQ